MKTQHVFCYIYITLRDSGELRYNFTDRIVKVHKVLYFADLFHRMFFGGSLIDNPFIALPIGPCMSDEVLDYQKVDIDYGFLSEKERQKINLCLKKVITCKSPCELIEISYGNYDDCPLTGWKKTMTQNCHEGLSISDDFMNHDVVVLKRWIGKSVGVRHE